jgi:hypothetical protein
LNFRRSRREQKGGDTRDEKTSKSLHIFLTDNRGRYSQSEGFISLAGKKL